MSKICIECGAKLDDKDLFCDECGTEQPARKEDGALSEQEKIAVDLEHTNSVGTGIKTCEVFISKYYNELEELERQKSGFDGKMMFVSSILFLIGVGGVILCFKKFGIGIGIISIFVIYKIWDVLMDIILKVKNRNNKYQNEADQKEYQDKKDELELSMKKYQKEMELLMTDVVYQKYSHVFDKRGIIPKAMIEALREGKANTIEEAEKFADY